MMYEHRFTMVMVLSSPDLDAEHILERNLKHAGFSFYTEGEVEILEADDDE